jgi:hypothetical protein
MEITHMENQPVEVLDDVVCDVCGRRVPPEDHECHEIIRIGGVGGYDSIIGDGVFWSLDICQNCFVERLGQFIQRKNTAMANNPENRQKFASVWDAIEDTPAEAENMKLRSTLMMNLKDFIVSAGLSQAEAAKLFKIIQPLFSDPIVTPSSTLPGINS